MKISIEGINLIKKFEGFMAKPYQDGGGVWTIGYGHTRYTSAGTPEITEQEAEELLREDLAHAQEAVNKLITVALTQNQFDALVSLVYNCGTAPLLRTLGQLLNKYDYAGAAKQFIKWCHDNGEIVEGLLIRRRAEADLFNRN